MKIYIPLKDGQAISQEVMKGLIVNDCEVCPITTKGEEEYKESNRNGNLLRAIECLDDEDLIFMDSDVILSTGIIQDVLDDVANLSQTIRTLKTDKGTHGLVCIKKERVKEFGEYLRGLDYTKADDHEHCTLCSFLNTRPNIMLQNEKVKECQNVS